MLKCNEYLYWKLLPLLLLNKDEIVVSGDKDGVMRAKDTIMKIYQEKVGSL